MNATNLLRLYRKVRGERMSWAAPAFGNCGEPCQCHAVYEPDPYAREQWDRLNDYTTRIKAVLDTKPHVEPRQRKRQGHFEPPKKKGARRRWKRRQRREQEARQRWADWRAALDKRMRAATA